jgi:hypothetical protein
MAEFPTLATPQVSEANIDFGLARPTMGAGGSATGVTRLDLSILGRSVGLTQMMSISCTWMADITCTILSTLESASQSASSDPFFRC